MLFGVFDEQRHAGKEGSGKKGRRNEKYFSGSGRRTR